jgi:hypothetical protein
MRCKTQVWFGEGSGGTCGALGEPKLVTAKAARSALILLSPMTGLYMCERCGLHC